MKLSIVSLSASAQSVSRLCAFFLRDAWTGAGHNVALVDISSLSPIWVNDGGIDNLPREYAAVEAELQSSDGLVLAHPIYCYTASSTAKVITEIFGKAFENKPVGIIAAAGSVRSHLAVGDLMLSMMFDRCSLCFPKSVIATKDDLDGNTPRPELAARLRAFGDDFARFAIALRLYRQTEELGEAQVHCATEADIAMAVLATHPL